MQFHDIELTGSLDISGSLTVDNSGNITAPARSTASFGAVKVLGFAGSDNDSLVDFSSSIQSRMQNAAAGGGEFAAGDSGSISGRLSGISGSLGANASLIRSLTAVGISGSFQALSQSVHERLEAEESDFTAAGISGSLGANASLIRSLNATGITGSFAAASGGFSDRITDDSGSFATRIQAAAAGGGEFNAGDSGSISGRLSGISGSLGANASLIRSLTAAGISGSLGTNANLIRSLTAAGVSGSLGANASLIRSLTATGITGSFAAASGGFSDRIGTDSASFSIRIQNAAAGGGEFSAGDSGSISGRLSGISGSLGVNASLIRSLTAVGISGSFQALSQSVHERLQAEESDFTATGISGSLGTNASLIRSLNATGISGSLGANANLIRSLTATGITGSFAAASGGFSDRITDDSGSFATRIQNAAAGGGEFNAGDSGSISGRLSGISGSLGTNASLIRSLTAAGISGSLGTNASLIRSLNATGISGSLGANASLIRSLTAVGISGSFQALSQSVHERLQAEESDFTATGISGSLGTNATLIRSLTAAGISGSLGTNASLIRSLTAVGVSGSLGANASLIRSLTAVGITGSFAAASGGFEQRLENIEDATTATVVSITSAATTWTCSHGLNNRYPTVTVWDSNNQVIQPQTIRAQDNNTTIITFSEAISGKASFTFGSGALSGSVNATLVSGSTQPGFTVGGSLIPGTHNLHDLGSPTRFWRDLYLSSGSLYIDGNKVLHSDSSELIIETSAGQSMKIIETGADDITLQTANGDIKLTNGAGNGNIELDSPVQVTAGNKVMSSDGNNIHFADGLSVSGSIAITGTVDGIDLLAMSGSLATRVVNAGSGEFSSGDSGSISGRLSGISGSLGTNAALIRSLNATGISGSFAAASGGLATRVTSFVDGTATSISGSGVSTGSFGHLMHEGKAFDTAVSESAAAAGFSTSGGGGGGSGIFTSGAGISQRTLSDIIVTGSMEIKASGSAEGNTLLNTNGNAGSILQLTDDLSTTLFSIAKASGAPLMEVSSSGRIALGPFSKPVLVDANGNLSGSGTQTGSFGHLLVDGNTMVATTANSIAALNAGIISGSSQLAAGISGSLGTNASLIRSLTAVGISGSLGANASLIRSLNATGISGSVLATSASIASDIAEFKNGTVTLVSGSGTSTGSFGHLMHEGKAFDTAVSESAAAAGFGSGGGGGGGGGSSIFKASGSFLSTTNDVQVSGSLTAKSTGSNSTIFAAVGTSEEMLTVTDSLSGSLFSVVRNSGIPVMEVFSDGNVDMHNLPTSDPGVPGRLYNDSGTLKISL